MFKRKFYKTLTLSLLTLSLMTTSLGGAFTTTALAASQDDPSPAVSSVSDKTTNTVVSDLVALGLIAALTNHGDKGASAAPSNKNTAPTAPQPSSITTSSPSQAVSRVTADEQRAFDLLNADRAANGLTPLKLNLAVTAVAERHAQDEINRNFFDHNNPDGQSPFDRMRSAGISFGYAGENLAINQNVTVAEQAFMNSPGHRSNILSPQYTEVGIGVRYNPQGSVYVVQNFID